MSSVSSFRAPVLIAAAFLCGWGLYAVPTARAKAEAALRPMLGVTEGEMKFADSHARRGEIDGQPVLFVEGSLVNASAHALKSPVLRVALIGDDGRPVYSWTAKPARAEIAASAETPFRTRLLAPPEKFLRIEISMAGAG